MSSVPLQKQQDDTGCGIACVAMLLDLSYSEAKQAIAKILRWTPAKKRFYTTARILERILCESGVKAKVHESNSWNEITGTAIVGVNRQDRHFHWVLVVKKSSFFVIIDPEYGECYLGSEWADVEDGYYHSKRKSSYVKVDSSVTSIGGKAICHLSCA